MEMPKRREASQMELTAVAQVRKYIQPLCPACKMPMHLQWWPSVSADKCFDVWYSCQNPLCMPNFRTKAITARNLAMAANDAYKAAFWRGRDDR